MKNNTDEKSLIVIENKNIITKVINFIRNIFKRNNNIIEQTEEINKTKTIEKRNFIVMDNIELKYQKFRNREIKEEDLTEEEKQKLIKIFQERIKIKREEINHLKKKVIQIRAEYLRITQ